MPYYQQYHNRGLYFNIFSDHCRDSYTARRPPRCVSSWKIKCFAIFPTDLIPLPYPHLLLSGTGEDDDGKRSTSTVSNTRVVLEVRLFVQDMVSVTNGTAVSLVGADPHRRRQQSGVHFCWALGSCDKSPNRYHVFGLPWPMYCMPSLAFRANQSQGEHYHDEPIRTPNRFQE